MHWQFLLLLVILSVVSAVLGFYCQVLYGYNLLFISIIISAFAQASISYFYMRVKGEASKVFFSLLFSAFTFFLAKYLLFEHYYDFFLEAYIDRSFISWNHIIFYFHALSFDSVFLFVNQMKNFMSVADVFVLVIMLLTSFVYLVLPFNSNIANIYNKNKRVRFNKRRF